MVNIGASQISQVFDVNDGTIYNIRESLLNYGENRYIPACAWGKLMEPIAKNFALDHDFQYSDKILTTEENFTHEDYPGMSCRPDGIGHNKRNNIKTLYEFKCPYSRTIDPDDLISIKKEYVTQLALTYNILRANGLLDEHSRICFLEVIIGGDSLIDYDLERHDNGSDLLEITQNTITKHKYKLTPQSVIKGRKGNLNYRSYVNERPLSGEYDVEIKSYRMIIICPKKGCIYEQLARAYESSEQCLPPFDLRMNQPDFLKRVNVFRNVIETKDITPLQIYYDEVEASTTSTPSTSTSLREEEEKKQIISTINLTLDIKTNNIQLVINPTDKRIVLTLNFV